MSNFFQSSSAIERATGMTEKRWLRYVTGDNDEMTDRQPTIQTLVNRTTAERHTKAKAERESNLAKYAERFDRGLPIFGEDSPNNDTPDDFDATLQCEDIYDWQEYETADEYRERMETLENLSA